TSPTTRTTTSVSADPTALRLDGGHAHGRPALGRRSPGQCPKARPTAKPATAVEPIGATVEAGSPLFLQLTSFDNLFECWLKSRRNKSQRIRVQRFNEDPLRHLVKIGQLLRARQYAFGPYKTFIVREKK